MNANVVFDGLNLRVGQNVCAGSGPDSSPDSWLIGLRRRIEVCHRCELVLRDAHLSTKQHLRTILGK